VKQEVISMFFQYGTEVNEKQTGEEEWESLLVVGQGGKPQVAAMRWWGRVKGVAGEQCAAAARIVRPGDVAMGAAGAPCRAIEGMAPVPGPAHLSRSQMRFVVRWKKGNKLLGIGSTNDPVETEKQAWEIVFSYARRRIIEESFRFQKTESLIESLRLQGWEPRRKLLLLLTLAYGFLLSALTPSSFLARSRLLVRWGQRADWRQWRAKRPLYRLRWASGAALALPSSLVCFLPTLSPTLSHHLVGLFIPLVDDPLASDWISVLTLCFGS
jgi:hypothetical protein